jgi:hypothetical protein
MPCAASRPRLLLFFLGLFPIRPHLHGKAGKRDGSQRLVDGERRMAQLEVDPARILSCAAWAGMAASFTRSRRARHAATGSWQQESPRSYVVALSMRHVAWSCMRACACGCCPACLFPSSDKEKSPIWGSSASCVLCFVSLFVCLVAYSLSNLPDPEI